MDTDVYKVGIETQDARLYRVFWSEVGLVAILANWLMLQVLRKAESAIHEASGQRSRSILWLFPACSRKL